MKLLKANSPECPIKYSNRTPNTRIKMNMIKIKQLRSLNRTTHPDNKKKKKKKTQSEQDNINQEHNFKNTTSRTETKQKGTRAVALNSLLLRGLKPQEQFRNIEKQSVTSVDPTTHPSGALEAYPKIQGVYFGNFSVAVRRKRIVS